MGMVLLGRALMERALLGIAWLERALMGEPNGKGPMGRAPNVKPIIKRVSI